MELSGRRQSADSAAIEDIPSSMQPKEADHERNEASPLQLRHLSRRGLPLRLPGTRRATHRTDSLRLRPSVPVRRELRLRQFLRQVAAASVLVVDVQPPPSPCRQNHSADLQLQGNSP